MMGQKAKKSLKSKGNGAISGIQKQSSSKTRNPKKFKNTRLFKLLRVIVILLVILILWNVIKRLTRKTPDKISLVIGEEKIALVHDIVIDQYNNIFMSIDDVKNIYDGNIYWNNPTLITTYNKHIAILELDKTTMKVNDVVQEIRGTLKEINGIIYLPFSDMEDVYDFEKSYNAETKVLSLDSKSIEKKRAVVLKSSDLKESTKSFAKTIEKVKKTQYVTVFKTEGSFTKVRTKAGNIGYIKTKKISEPEVLWETMDEETLQNVVVLQEYSIVDDKYEVLTDAKSNTIVLPNLFEIVQTEDSKVEMENVIQLEGSKFEAYKNWAEQSNISICPTIVLKCSMSKVCANYETRSYIINTLYNTLINHRMTMICIDFTEIDDIEGLYRFVTEMVPRFKCAGMKVLIRYNSTLNQDRINHMVDYVLH